MDPFLEESQSSGPGFDPMGMARTFWRRKWLLIIPFILCFSMAAVAIKIMTPIYYSAGQVRIIVNNTETHLINNAARRYGSPKQLDRLAYQEMDLLLTSPEFLEKMVQDLNLHLSLRQAQAQAGMEPISEERALKQAVSRLKSMLRIDQNGSHLFLIGVRDTDPDQAYRLISHILEAFLTDYRASQLAFRTSTRDFLEGQLEGYRQTLANAEQELTGFQSGMASSTLLDNPINARNLSNADINLGHMKDRQRGSDRTEMARLKQEAQAVVDPLPRLNRYRTDPSITAVIREMVDLALAQSLLAQTNRGFRDFDDNLARLRISLNTLVENKVTSDYPNLGFMDRNRISQYVYFSLFQSGLKQVADSLALWINDFRSFTAKQPEQSARLGELQDAVLQAGNLVRTMEKEIVQQNLNLEASESEIGFQIKVRQKPSRPVVPIEPNKQKLLLMGFLLSLGIGFGLAVLAMLLDRSFTSVDDIERTLGLTVIGTLPVIQDDIFERKRKLKILRWVTIVLGILAIAAVGFLVVYPRLS
jgi:polysaccharide biosynthesis transport protein